MIPTFCRNTTQLANPSHSNSQTRRHCHFHRARVMFSVVVLGIALLLTTTHNASAQSRIYGTLNPVSSSGTCRLNRPFATDTSVNRVAGIWFLRDKKDLTVSPRGLGLSGVVRSTFPSSVVTSFETIPGTLFTYTSNYSFSGWDKRRKTVNMLKQSWVYTGWGLDTVIYCYGGWAGTVKYN